MTLAFAMGDARTARPAALAAMIERHGKAVCLDREEELYAQDEDVDLIYLVVRGVVRTTRMGVDGRRQVGGFYYAGDILGLETGPQHLFAAEALTDVEVVAARRASIRAFAGDSDLDRAILDATRLELVRAQNHALMLGLRNAREKVAAFLLAACQSEAGQVVELAMSRQDMADYLGLTIETVSRMLGQLKDEALVEFPSTRQFRVPRWDALEALAA